MHPRFVEFPLAKLSLALMTGAVMANWLPSLTPYSTIALPLIGLTALLSWRWSTPRVREVFLLAGAFLLSALRLQQTPEANTRVDRVIQSDHPSLFTFRVLDHTPSGRYIVELQAGRGADQAFLAVGFPLRDSSKLQAGQLYSGIGRIRPVAGPAAPWSADFRRYWKRRGVSSEVYWYYIQPVGPNPPSTGSNRGMAMVRDRAGQGVDRLSSLPWQRGLLRALLLGDTSALGKDTRQLFNRAGVGHVLAVSGLHVGLVFGLLNLLLRPVTPLLRNRRLTGLLAIPPLVLYAWLTGWSHAVNRALIMCASWVLVRQLGRHTDSYAIYSLALATGLLWDPGAVFQAGFQLSFAAVLALIWGHKQWRRLHPRWIKGVWRGRLAGAAWMTLCAQGGTLPFVLFHFGFLPLLFLPANLLLLPVVPVLLVLGFGGLILELGGLLPGWLPLVMEQSLTLLERVLWGFGAAPDLLFIEYRWGLGGALAAGVALLALARLVVRVTTGRMLALTVTIAIGLGMKLHQDIGRLHLRQSWITHERGSGRLWIREGRTLMVYTQRTEKVKLDSGDFRIWRKSNGIRTIILKDPAQAYRIGDGCRLIILDRRHRAIPKVGEELVLWLREGSWIHLEKLLDSYPVIAVVADGSNSRQALARWEASCLAKRIPFHRTDRDGYFTWSAKYRSR